MPFQANGPVLKNGIKEPGTNNNAIQKLKYINQRGKSGETEWYFIGVEEQEVLGFRKSKLNTSIDRIRRCAIWIASQMFRDCFDEKGLDEVFMRSVFAEEHNFIDWDGFFYPRSWIQYQ